MEHQDEVVFESKHNQNSLKQNVDYTPHQFGLGLTFRAWCSVISITILSIILEVGDLGKTREVVQCGGNLINDQWLLTDAAHCTNNEAFDEPIEIGVLLGSNKLDDDEEEIVKGELTLITIIHITQHYDYNGQMMSYDFFQKK